MKQLVHVTIREEIDESLTIGGQLKVWEEVVGVRLTDVRSVDFKRHESYTSEEKDSDVDFAHQGLGQSAVSIPPNFEYRLVLRARSIEPKGQNDASSPNLDGVGRAWQPLDHHKQIAE